MAATRFPVSQLAIAKLRWARESADIVFDANDGKEKGLRCVDRSPAPTSVIVLLLMEPDPRRLRGPIWLVQARDNVKPHAAVFTGRSRDYLPSAKLRLFSAGLG